MHWYVYVLRSDRTDRSFYSRASYERPLDTTAPRMTIPLLQHIPSGIALIHIGAHYGQEAPAYSAHNAPVLWIEACPLFIPRLQQQLINHPQQQCRLGAVAAREGQRRVFHLSNNMEGVSSSFFNFGAGAQELWPELQLRHTRSTGVTTTTLDNLIEQEHDWISQHNPTALVIDTQGAEVEVIQGGSGSLWRFDWIQVETSIATVYTNGNTREAVHQLLTAAGFAMTAEIEQCPGHGDRIYKRIEPISSADDCFNSPNYQAINAARLKHLSQLPLELEQQSVLELGSGPGDLTAFWLDRQCCITRIDARPENIRAAALKHHCSLQWSGFVYELPHKIAPDNTSYDLVIAYGVLYHLQDPLCLLHAVAAMKPRQFVLETCVTSESSTESSGYPLYRCGEQATDGSQSVTGVGCRPDRRWLWKKLQALFKYVYCSRHQPNHPEFPLNWEASPINNSTRLTRMVFICSSEPINSNLITESLPVRQQP